MDAKAEDNTVFPFLELPPELQLSVLTLSADSEREVWIQPGYRIAYCKCNLENTQRTFSYYRLHCCTNKSTSEANQQAWLTSSYRHPRSQLGVQAHTQGLPRHRLGDVCVLSRLHHWRCYRLRLQRLEDMAEPG